MGPTNIALVKLFQADQVCREAKARLDSATKDVRIQERRLSDLEEKLKLAQATLKENQARAGNLELDLKTRDAHIERLRTQQQNAKNNREYQAFLIEINTEKIDRNKVEEEVLKGLETVERGSAEVKELAALAEVERQKLQGMREKIGDTIALLQSEIDQLKAKVDEAAKDVTPKALQVYERLAERLDGEAMAAICKPNRRREEYDCAACNMSLVVDVYNRLHTRDDITLCPSCGRILYIPEDLPVQEAVHTKAAPKEKRSPRGKNIGAPVTRGTLATDVLKSTQGEDAEAESVESAESATDTQPSGTQNS